MAREMSHVARSANRRPRLGLVACAFLAASLLGTAARVTRADEIGRDGLFITVPHPITENAVLQIEHRIQDAVERQGRTLAVVVFDFNPHGKPAGTSNVFPCMQLQDYIGRLSLGQVRKCPRVLTVAYVQEEVTDHTVLPVLACREIVMSSKGKLGHVLRSQDGSLAKEAYQAYREAFQAKSKPALLEKLMEPSKNLSMVALEEAQKLGLCQAHVETRPDVKDLYGLPALACARTPWKAARRSFGASKSTER